MDDDSRCCTTRGPKGPWRECDVTFDGNIHTKKKSNFPGCPLKVKGQILTNIVARQGADKFPRGTFGDCVLNDNISTDADLPGRRRRGERTPARGQFHLVTVTRFRSLSRSPRHARPITAVHPGKFQAVCLLRWKAAPAGPRNGRVGARPCLPEPPPAGGRDAATSTEESAGLFIKIFYLKASVTKAKRVFSTSPTCPTKHVTQIKHGRVDKEDMERF